jgi:hypothetical protein
VWGRSPCGLLPYVLESARVGVGSFCAPRRRPRRERSGKPVAGHRRAHPPASRAALEDVQKVVADSAPSTPRCAPRCELHGYESCKVNSCLNEPVAAGPALRSAKRAALIL